jgi:hypothetical protein
MTILDNAVEEYNGRNNGTIHAPGYQDDDGHWILTEILPCCNNKTRLLLYKHARSLEHVANLFHVNKSTLSVAVRRALHASWR